LPFSQEGGFIRTQQKSTLFTVLIWFRTWVFVQTDPKYKPKQKRRVFVLYQILVNICRMTFLQKRGFGQTSKKSTLFTVLIWANIMCIF
jgi:hypothetical protein